MSLEIPTALERRIEIRTEFFRESGVFRITDGVMKAIALRRCDSLCDEYNMITEIEHLDELGVMQPINDPLAD